MESAIIVTYRCNARCLTCNTWQNPSRVEEEFEPRILESLPSGQTKINITGGEPTLRKDLLDIIGVLRPKTSRLEISTNGSLPEKLFTVADRYPDIVFRISVDGLRETNDAIRGLKNGFGTAMQSLEGLRQRGVANLGIAMTISDRNIGDLIPLYRLTVEQGWEFTQCVPHNSHYFHKQDNEIRDIPKWEAGMRAFIEELLQSKRRSPKLRIKDWFRAYLNSGLLLHVTRGARPLACRAGTDFFFVDPFGDILPCNGMEQKVSLGNLKSQSFDQIWHSEKAQAIRRQVGACDRGCWMIGSAVPALRRNVTRIVLWVAKHKLMCTFGKLNIEHENTSR